MQRNACAFLAVLLVASVAARPALAQTTVELVNNHEFAIRMPWIIRGAQADVSGDVAVPVDLPPNGRASVPIGLSALEKVQSPLSVSPDGNRVRIRYGQRDLGRLSWAIVLRKAAVDAKDDAAASAIPQLPFKPLALKFSPATPTNGFATAFSAEASEQGLRVTIRTEHFAQPPALDIRTTVTNESAPQKNVYAAVIRRWEQPPGANRSVCYDNHVFPLAAGVTTPWRSLDRFPNSQQQQPDAIRDARTADPALKRDTRHLQVQRGIDWLATRFGDAGPSVVWLNDFSPSFTVHHEAAAKKPAQWIGANAAHLAEEAKVNDDGSLDFVTELARPNIRSYRSRLDDNVLPDKTQPLSFTSRVLFDDMPVSDEQVDHAFVAYTSYNEQSKSSDGRNLIVQFGVPYTKFGTAYFPYSTLGENFGRLHMPGMSQEGYWPLAADTVKQWNLFADDIRRDLRIAKAMGFESIRLHHLEMLEPLDKSVRQGYLDFFFGQLKMLGLTALLDVKLPPNEVADLVKRYREQIDGVEVDNEVLIFGIPDDGPAYWNSVYDAVKRVAPDLPVHLTGHTNVGAFDRLRRLGVKFDRVGEHAYQDSLDAIPSGRDFALAASDYGTEIGKPPVITEWNWRGLTRLTPEARAKVYPPIFENVLATRCMPEIYQFQFQDSLAMAPATLKGIRHYELLNLSRRPRPEAIEFMKLIQRYASPTMPQRLITIPFQQIELSGGSGEVTFAVTNNGEAPLELTAVPETSDHLRATLRGMHKLTLAAKQTINVPVQIAPANGGAARPGFYHVFLRLEGANGFSAYGWAAARQPGAPGFDRDTTGAGGAVTYGSLDFDFNQPLAVVYGDGAPVLELEGAWVLYQTLEAATGRPVQIYHLPDLPEDVKRSGAIVAFGTPRSNALIGQSGYDVSGKQFVIQSSKTDSRGDRLLVGGATPQDALDAAMDLTLRYWKYANDSGARRIPLTDKPIEKGADAGQLP